MTKVVNNFAGLNGCVWWMGANIVRVHDVKPTVDALKIVSAVMQN